MAILIAVTAVVITGCGTDGSDARSASTRPDVTFADATTDQPSDPATPATTDGAKPRVTVELTADAIVFTPYAEGFTDPVDLAWRSGDPAVYVVQQNGLIARVLDGAVRDTVLDLVDTVSYGGEQGLLGLAFHPTEALAYVNYTREGDGATVIAEYVVGANGVFDPGSAREVLVIDQPYANHNGGDLTFGPDGYLYIGTGDGGSGGDPERRATDVGELLGKMLRIDPTASGTQPYTVPSDNPFVGVDGARPEIWAVGLRNPWRFNFDSATGDLWIGDVGQGEWEEIDLVRAVDGGGRGLNFGWSAWEGTHRFNDDESPDGATFPIFEYEHGDLGCSVSGGDVYRGSAVPSLVGWYLFSDYCSGIVTALRATDGVLDGQLQLGTLPSVSAISSGPNGELYVLSLGDGTVYRIDAA